MGKQSLSFSKDEIDKNHSHYLERLAVYKKVGFDREEAAKTITGHIFKENKSILEIGTGKGHLTAALAQYFEKVVSADINEDDQRIAGLNAAYYDRLDKIEFIAADAGNLDYPDNTFDAVVSAFTYHHLDEPDKVINEMIRVASSQIVISDFNRKGFETIEKVHNSEGKTHEIISGNFNALEAYLKNLNLEVKVSDYEHQKIYSIIKN